MKKLYLNETLFDGTEEEFIAIEKFHKKEWYQDGKKHRDGGPAIIYADGSEAWYQNDKLHRIDGPAVINSDLYQAWWINGKLHRTDGPAKINKQKGLEEWWVNGFLVGKENHRIICKFHLIKSILNS